jgi:hypothetical protein
LHEELKEVRKMNRKMTFLVIALVSTILPAVAVADVMITGNVSIQGTANSNVFYLTPGPNFQAADGSIAWNHYNHYTTNNHYMGDLKFAEVSNQTTFIINVMEIVFNPNTPAGMFYLNSTVGSPFTTDSVMYLSLAPMTFGDFSYSGLPGATPTVLNPGITAFPLDSAQSYSTPVDGSTIIYIGFFTPGYNVNTLTGELFLTGTYVSG